MTDNIEILIAKYCSDQLTDAEQRTLTNWVESGENRKVFNDYISLNYTVEQLKSQNQDDSILWNQIESKIKAPVQKLNYWKYAVAASVLLVIGLTVFMNRDSGLEFINTDSQIVVNNTIETGSNKAVLTTENGENIVLEKGQIYFGDDVSSDGEKLIYTDTLNVTKTEIAYNYMTVPRGGQFYIELSDSTRVWLNSDSKIKYPKKFLANQVREVELLYGEAYFEVSSSSNHHGAKFRVFTKGQEVEVLGTEFNIKSNQNEHLIFTTLVEGKVKVGNGVNMVELRPSQQSVVNLSTNAIDLKEVNAKDQVSWKNGVFNFNGMPLHEIMKAMELWYDVEVEFEDKSLVDIKFIGTFRKDQNIEYILLTLKNSNIINSYEIENQKVILK